MKENTCNFLLSSLFLFYYIHLSYCSSESTESCSFFDDSKEEERRLHLFMACLQLLLFLVLTGEFHVNEEGCQQAGCGGHVRYCERLETSLRLKKANYSEHE